MHGTLSMFIVRLYLKLKNTFRWTFVLSSVKCFLCFTLLFQLWFFCKVHITYFALVNHYSFMNWCYVDIQIFNVGKVLLHKERVCLFINFLDVSIQILFESKLIIKWLRNSTLCDLLMLIYVAICCSSGIVSFLCFTKYYFATCSLGL